MRFRRAVAFWQLLFVVTAADLTAQQRDPARPLRAQGRISGMVLSAESNQPIVAAAIILRSAADSSVVAGLLTGADGKFRIEDLPPGRYLLGSSHVGYSLHAAQVVTLTTAHPHVDLGALKMEVAPIELSGVQAEAARAPVVLGAEGTVYHTKELPAAAGSALDVLRAVPELEVDIHGTIALRGSQAVAIHLNGRPAIMRGDQLTNFLQQLPGNRVARVEVVPNPSARHDPEGMGGIVNIVLRETIDVGLSGSLSLNASTRLTRGVSGRFNLQRGRLTLFTGAGINWSESESNAYDLRQNLMAQPATYIEQHTYRLFDARFANADLTAEFKLGKQSTLWTSAWWQYSGSDNEQNAAYGILDQTRTERDRYNRVTTGGGYMGSADATFGFKHVFQPQRHELTADLRIAAGDMNADSEWLRQYLLSEGQPVVWPTQFTVNDVVGDNRNLSLQADYLRPLGTRGRLEIGYRAWKRGESNDNRIDVFASPQTTLAQESTRAAYDYDEIFHSLYTTVSETRGKVTLQLGVRTELAGTTFGVPTTREEFDHDYNSVFPSGSVAYAFGPGRSARLSYAKRIGRPSPFILNPYNPTADPLNRYHGNPDIDPTYTHSLNLDLSWIGRTGTLRVSPYYRETVNNWDQIRTVDAQGVSTMTWANVASLQTLGSSFIASLRPTGRWHGSANVSLHHENRDASNLADDYSRRSWRWSASLVGGYTLTPSLSATANLRYSPPYTLIQGRASGMFYSTIGVRQQIWNTKGSLSLFVTDPFDLYRFNFTTSDRTHVQISRTTLKQRMATLSFTYNFGRPPQQNSRRQTDESAAPTTIIR
jgi:outer membrane cobalamin receptor